MRLERAYNPKPGDIFHTTIFNENVQQGQQYENYPAIVWKIFYKHKPWYFFWKKKEIEGISVLWLGDQNESNTNVQKNSIE